MKQVEEAVWRLRSICHRHEDEQLVISMSSLMERVLVQELSRDYFYIQNVRDNPPIDGIKQIFGIEMNNLWPYNSEIMVYHKTLACRNPNLLIKIETGK